MATRKQKELEKKKEHARQLLAQKPTLSVRDLENLTGLSHTTAHRLKQSLSQSTPKSTLSATKPPATPGIPSESREEEDEQGGIEFEESPDPVEDEHKSIIDQGMDTLRGLLGFGNGEERKSTTPPIAAKLDARRQAFVDNVSPTVSLAFTLSAAWMWGRIGPDYKGLAPDDQTAQRICEPLVRIYARHASFLTDINPDYADAGASLVALIGYVYASLGMYQHIKQEKEASEQENSGGNVSQFNRRSEPTQQSGASYPSGRYASVSGGNRGYGTGPGANDTGSQSGINRNDLTGKEAAQLASLSRLSELDYQHRARRAGRL